MTVEEALELARRHGINVVLEGDGLNLEADAPPPPGLLAILGRGKWDIVAALRLREAEERRRLVQWVDDHFASTPPGVCAHCGDGLRFEDPFVLLFVGNDRGEVHASCHGPWLAEREAEARRALGLEVHPSIRNQEPSRSRRTPQWIPSVSGVEIGRKEQRNGTRELDVPSEPGQ